MSVISVRRAGPGDRPALVGFQVAMALETEGRKLDRQVVESGVEGIFTAPSRGFYLVAETEGKPVGSLMITTEWSDWRAGTFWWIQSVYVEPEWRKRGVFRALYRETTAMAAAADGVCGIRLYVEKGNRPAREVYARLGMVESGYRLYEVDWGVAEG